MFQEVTITILLIPFVTVFTIPPFVMLLLYFKDKNQKNILFCAISPYLVVYDIYLKWLVRNWDSICLMEIIKVKGLS